MATEYELTFIDYLSIMRRRAPVLIAVFLTVLLISVAVAITIPPTYRATGTIMVESLQITDNIVPSVIRNKLDEQINLIKQRIMTRENLLQIANKYSLFKWNIVSLNSTELTEKMRDRIVVETVSPGDSMRTNRQGQEAIAFTLSFEDRHPEVAFQVTNDLITLFLDWNVKLRKEGAMETTFFLSQESNKLKVEVDRLEALIAAYKQQHKEALPEQLTLRMTMLARAENDLREVERDYRSTREELRSLEVELSAAKHGTTQENPTQTLPALQAELTRLSALYKETHPDIRIIKRKIESMEKTAGTSLPEPSSTDVSNVAMYRIQAKIDSDKARLVSLVQQREMLQAKISENERAMILTPKVGQDLDVLIRDRDSAQRKYEEIRNKKMNAKIAEHLETENISGRFSVLEPPLLPEKPFKPDRIKIILLGFFLAMVSSGGAMMFLESIDKRIYGTEALTHVLGYRPLVVVPYLAIQEDGARRKRMLKLAIITGVIALIATIVALISVYTPLDIMFLKS
ncbi:MAG TPA: lipopolysaccharide biosynthesis protein [Gallionellaceae bacterium]|nr:lipopolysaccharide biosynthesis protein [Gallionellaceae bacterium]